MNPTNKEETKKEDPYVMLIERKKQEFNNFYVSLESCVEGTYLNTERVKKVYNNTPYKNFQCTEDNVIDKIAENPFLYRKYKKLVDKQGLSLPLYEDDFYIQKRNTFAHSVMPFNITNFEKILQCIRKNDYGIKVLDQAKFEKLCGDEIQEGKSLIESIRLSSKYKDAFDFITHEFCVDVGEEEIHPCSNTNYIYIAQQYMDIRKLCFEHEKNKKERNQNKTEQDTEQDQDKPRNKQDEDKPRHNEIIFQAIYLRNPVKVFLIKGFYRYLHKIKRTGWTTTPVDKMLNDVFEKHRFMQSQLDEFLRTNNLD